MLNVKAVAKTTQIMMVRSQGQAQVTPGQCLIFDEKHLNITNNTNINHESNFNHKLEINSNIKPDPSEPIKVVVSKNTSAFFGLERLRGK